MKLPRGISFWRRASAALTGLALLATLSLPARATDAADHWAVVNANGTLARGFGVKSVVKLGTGGYRITFEAKSIAQCGYLITMGPAAAGQSAPSGYWQTERPPSPPNSKNILDVFTYSASVGGSLPTFANVPSISTSSAINPLPRRGACGQWLRSDAPRTDWAASRAVRAKLAAAASGDA